MKLGSKLSSYIFVLAVSIIPAVASVVTYSGEDIMSTTTSAHPSSTGAAASFGTAVAGLGTTSLVTFEGYTLGSFSNLTIAPGVTLNGSDINGANQTIRNTSNSPTIPTLDGYNTTPGGSYFVEVQAGTLTFTFASGVDAFGAYFSGVQNFYPSESITFADGTSEIIGIPETGTTNSIGALAFVGFTDVGKSITSLTINAGNASTGDDYIGVDDVQFTTMSAATGVPEPTSIALALSASLALPLFLVLRRRSAPTPGC